MEALSYQDLLACHKRSASLPPPFTRPEGKLVSITADRASGTGDFETVTYLESQQRKGALALKEECATFINTISDYASNYSGVRQNGVVRAYLDTATAYIHQAEFLEVSLTGWGEIHFLLDEDMKKAIDSLGRAKTNLVSASWRILRYADLWAVHESAEPTGRLTWSITLGEHADTGKLDAELKCYHFWTRVRKEFEPLLKDLQKQLAVLESAVNSTEDNKYPAFLQEMHASQRENQNAAPRYEMSGALPIDASADNWDAQSDQTLINPPVADISAAAFEISYDALRARDRIRRGSGNDAQESLEGWLAFRQELVAHPGPPTTDMTLLIAKADTEISIAKHFVQEQHAAQGSGSGSGSGSGAGAGGS